MEIAIQSIFKEFIFLLAQESARIILQYYRKEISISTKSDDSPVTIADKMAEEKMRELIIKKFPEHGILGEELGSYHPDAEYQWILDPIDGTRSFICGTPLFGTLIALLKNGKPVLGAMNFPVLGQFFLGDNLQTLLNDKMVQMRKIRHLSEAVLLTTDIQNIEKYQDITRFQNLVEQVQLFRTWGDCFGYSLLAAGFADIMVDPVMSAWDIMALIPIIKGAGGEITDYQGNDPAKGNSIIAASPSLHQKVIELLNKS
jgi:histidinol phosphatase-like enzyme (inositol monophosphatase family)